MTKEQLDAIIAMGPILVAAAASTVVSVFGVVKFFDYLIKYQKAKFAEQSVGLTKIIEFEKANAQVLLDLNQLRLADKNLQESDEIQQKHLDQLDRDYREMVGRVLDFYRGK